MIATVNLFGVSCTYLPSSRQLSTSSKKEETASKSDLFLLMTLRSQCVRVVVDQVILEVHVILKTPSISILGVLLTLTVKLTIL